MTRLEQIKQEIVSLPEQDFAQLRDWLADLDFEPWDRQIEADAKAGKLDFLIKEALDEKKRGTLGDL
jgi:hypothetical protein